MDHLTESARIHAGRANVYRVLADCFLPPEQLDRAALGLLDGELDRISPGLKSQAQALCRLFPSPGDPTWETLRVAHARLFVGPFDLLAPPYGSVYLDGERLLMGPSSLDVQRHYAAAGVDMPEAAGGPPDHVAVELEFMYFLAYQSAATHEARYLDASRTFLHEQLGRWFPAFSTRIQEYGSHEFYRQLGSLAADFVAWDEQWLFENSRTEARAWE